jgi:hypothetical protein
MDPGAHIGNNKKITDQSGERGLASLFRQRLAYQIAVVVCRFIRPSLVAHPRRKLLIQISFILNQYLIPLFLSLKGALIDFLQY